MTGWNVPAGTVEVTDQEAVDALYRRSPADGEIRVYVPGAVDVTLPAMDWAVYGSGTIHVNGGRVDAYNRVRVHAWGATSVHAYDTAWVAAHHRTIALLNDSAVCRAYDKACVHAHDGSHAVLFDQAIAQATHQARVDANDDTYVRGADYSALNFYCQARGSVAGNAGFVARDRTVVHATGAATGTVDGRAQVDVEQDAYVRVLGRASATVSAGGTVLAAGSGMIHTGSRATVLLKRVSNAQVHAYSDDATIVRTGHGAEPAEGVSPVVRLIGCSPQVHGPIRRIQMPSGEDDPLLWLLANAKKADDHRFVVYKALDEERVSGRMFTPTQWPLEGEVTAPDWNPKADVGGGLHLSPTPSMARHHNRDATLVLKCLVSADDVVLLRRLPLTVKALSVDVVGEVPPEEWF